MPPQEPLGLLIVAARQSLRHAIGARTRHLRLTTQQFWAIVSLRQRAGLTPGELGHHLLLDAPAASRLVSMLAHRKLVEMKPDRDDRRRTRVFLTASGEALAAKLAPIVDEFRASVVQGMSEQEIAHLRDALRRVVANLATFVAEAEAEPPPRVARAS